MMGPEYRFTKLGTNLADLESAWRDRMTDADILKDSGRNAAAVMMGLYAVEILLKCRLCKKLDLKQLPKAFEVHDLDGLLLLAGLSRRMSTRSALRTKANWTFIVRSSARLNEMRYSPDARWLVSDTETFFEQLTGEPDGLIPWVLRQR